MDDDLDAMTRDELIAEARKLREGIRAHPALWGLLPERTDPMPDVPTWPEFLEPEPDDFV